MGLALKVQRSKAPMLEGQELMLLGSKPLEYKGFAPLHLRRSWDD